NWPIANYYCYDHGFLVWLFCRRVYEPWQEFGMGKSVDLRCEWYCVDFSNIDICNGICAWSNAHDHLNDCGGRAFSSFSADLGSGTFQALRQTEVGYAHIRIAAYCGGYATCFLVYTRPS